MQERETQQINEFELIDDLGNEYTIFEYQEGIQKRSLKWIKAGQSWFRLSDGTPVDKVDENTFKIAIGRDNSYGRGATPFSIWHRDLKKKPHWRVLSEVNAVQYHPIWATLLQN